MRHFGVYLSPSDPDDLLLIQFLDKHAARRRAGHEIRAALLRYVRGGMTAPLPPRPAVAAEPIAVLEQVAAPSESIVAKARKAFMK
jgi:hypothetical protein